MESLIPSVINLTLLLALLVYYLRRPFAEFLRSRHQGVATALREAQEQLRLAEKDYNEFSAKLKAIGAETQAIRDQAKEDARASRERILSEAQTLSNRVLADAKSTAQAMVQDLQAQLYLETAEGVFNRVEIILKERLTGEDQVRIRRQFSEQVRTAL